MAYHADPSNLFTGYSTDEGGFAAFPIDYLPSCSGNSNNLNDIKEILFSLLTVVDEDYNSLPPYASGVDVQTQARNFTISSQLRGLSNNTTVKTFSVSFTANSPLTDVADEPAYNPD